MKIRYTVLVAIGGYDMDELIAAPSNNTEAYKGFVNDLFNSVNIA